MNILALLAERTATPDSSSKTEAPNVDAQNNVLNLELAHHTELRFRNSLLKFLDSYYEGILDAILPLAQQIDIRLRRVCDDNFDRDNPALHSPQGTQNELILVQSTRIPNYGFPFQTLQRVNLQLAERIARAKERPDGVPRVELR